MKRIRLTSLVFLGLFALICVGCSAKSEFTPEKWARTSITDRHELCDSLLAKYGLIGMTKDEVLDLLGEPIHPPTYEKWNYDDESYSYYVGFDYVGDLISLSLYFDEEGKVYKIYDRLNGAIE